MTIFVFILMFIVVVVFVVGLFRAWNTVDGDGSYWDSTRAGDDLVKMVCIILPLIPILALIYSLVVG